MVLDSYTERGYDDGGYIVVSVRMADGTTREIKLEEDTESLGGVLVKIVAP